MNESVAKLAALWRATTDRLNGVGASLSPLGLRLILAWEFGEAGFEKLNGSNWFTEIQDSFPFPFSAVSPDLSWAMATSFEILGAFALALGLFTRFFAYSLLVLTFVATAAVHWPESWSGLGELWRGYAISDSGYGNFKLPLLFALMLVPLVLGGAGRLSLDRTLAARLLSGSPASGSDATSWALGAALFGLPLATLFPVLGLGLVGAGAAGLIVGHYVTGRQRVPPSAPTASGTS